jgi:hypothetical protein
LKSENQELAEILSHMEAQNQNTSDKIELLTKNLNDLNKENLNLKENLKNCEDSLTNERSRNSENVEKIREIESFSKSIVNMVRTLGLSLNIKNSNAPLRSFRAKNDEEQSI